jgi:uncharacterized protein YqeY
MAIQDELTGLMKDAMRARDARTLDVIRMLKSKMSQETTKAGFSGEVNDALWVKVISAYAKSQRKAVAVYEKAGEAGRDHIAQINWEVAFMGQWLPKMADEATVRAWVGEAIDGLGGREKANLGAVMGTVMKAHRGVADPNMVRRLIQDQLS